MAVSAEQVRLILGTLILALMAASLVVRRRLRLAAIAGSALVGASSVACLDHARAAQRYASYAEAGAGESYDVAPVPLGDQAVAWQALDGEQSTVVAFVAGYTTPGYQWFRYPLFGRRLQNRVLYVSARADGRVPETWRTGGLDPTLDADAWGTRLRAEHVDWIMLAAPQPAEARLIYARPDLFEPVIGFAPLRLHVGASARPLTLAQPTRHIPNRCGQADRQSCPSPSVFVRGSLRVY